MSRKISWISVSYYPFFLAATCFALVFYKFFPSTSALLLNFSLLVVCTILFLRILLRYGTQNAPRISKNERMTLRSSSLKVELIKNDLRAKKLESLRCDPQARSRRTFKGMTIRTAVPGDDDERYSAASKALNEIEVCQMDVSSSTLVYEDYFGSSLVNDTDEQSAEGVLDVCQEACAATTASENLLLSGEDADASRLENSDSCLGSPWCLIDHQDAVFDTDVDGVESSDPGAEKAAPMLDELDPHVSMEKSDNNSSFSKNQVVGIGDAIEREHKGDGEVAQEKNVGSKIPIKLMDLGESEIERNRRLESLIAKRKARKAKERNLTNLDDSRETSKTNSQLPSITAPRSNPFDLLYDFDESMPGSAPSTLIPRINIFDLSDEMDDDLLTNKNFVTLPSRDMLFRRHESFTVGAPFFSDFTQARRSTRFRFLFDEVKNEQRVTSDADLHRSSGEVGGSKFSFTSESDTDSTISNQENEEDLAQESHSPLEHTEQNSHSSEDIESMGVEQVENQMNIGNDHANQVIEDFGTMQDEASEISVSSSLVAFAADRPELIGDKTLSNYCIPPEAESDSSKTATREEGSELKQNGGGFFSESTVPSNSIVVDSDAVNVEANQVNGSHHEEPAYDSNPTRNDRLNSTTNEALSNAVSALKTTDGDNVVGGRTESSFMDENESVSRHQISETKKLDIYTKQEDLNDPILPSLAEAPISQNIHHPNSLSTEIESSKSS